jgi:hypothetical protein
MNVERSNLRQSKLLLASTFGLILLVPMGVAQTQVEPQSSAEPKPIQQLQVNWLYGAYVPKNVPLQSLSNQQRFQLFLRQSFTTPGVYVKTALFPCQIKPPIVRRNGAMGSVAMPNELLRATDNSLRRMPWREWATVCSGSSLDTIAASAAGFGRARDMLLSGTS